jgi:hypothetical protein
MTRKTAHGWTRLLTCRNASCTRLLGKQDSRVRQVVVQTCRSQSRNPHHEESMTSAAGAQVQFHKHVGRLVRIKLKACLCRPVGFCGCACADDWPADRLVSSRCIRFPISSPDPGLYVGRLAYTSYPLACLRMLLEQHMLKSPLLEEISRDDVDMQNGRGGLSEGGAGRRSTAVACTLDLGKTSRREDVIRNTTFRCLSIAHRHLYTP